MKLTAAQIQSATLSQCEDWLEEIALNIVVLDGRIYSTAGEERAGAERYLSKLKTLRYAIGTRYGKLNRRAGEKLRMKNLLLDELRDLVGSAAYADCKRKAVAKMQPVIPLVTIKGDE
ncbi:hypothetical protein [Winslowiella toletana]|uniref:hypothetical protein n=1 Tax=Winslowiella toletana TaxID=92490 RepID=UPI0028BDE79D|nr:hypothetical protein [Winslowiella toletana]WNN42817.1 hypothetical protein RIN69_13950 [Winslowiella toletana]